MARLGWRDSDGETGFSASRCNSGGGGGGGVRTASSRRAVAGRGGAAQAPTPPSPSAPPGSPTARRAGTRPAAKATRTYAAGRAYLSGRGGWLCGERAADGTACSSTGPPGHVMAERHGFRDVQDAGSRVKPRHSQGTRMGQTAGPAHLVWTRFTPICSFYIRTRRRRNVADLEAARVCAALGMGRRPDAGVLLGERARTKDALVSIAACRHACA